MLQVRVEIVPGGKGTPREIATLTVGNVSQLADVSDYIWWLEVDGRKIDVGDTIGHTRSDGWEKLVHNILGQITGYAPREVNDDLAIGYHLLKEN